jgi:peptidoglycan/LPS O-acetylase OafA/YrhL
MSTTATTPGIEHHRVGGAIAPRDRFDALDSLRGICALLVALHHFVIFSNANLAKVGFVQNAFLFVDFFFVLSGFVICHAYGSRIAGTADLANFMIRRFGRLWPLHAAVLAAFLLMILLCQLLPHPAFLDLTLFKGSRFSLAKLLLATIFLGSFHIAELGWNMPSWSISAEFAMYFVFGLVCIAGRRRLPLISALVVLGALLFLSRLRGVYITTTSDFGLVRCALGFFLGVLVYFSYRSFVVFRALSRTFATAIETVTIVIAIAYVSLVAGAEPSPSSATLAAPFVFALVVFSIAIGRGALSSALVAKPAIRLGELSYSIYMVHWMVFMAADWAIFMISAAIKVPSPVGPWPTGNDLILTFTHPIYADILAIPLCLMTIGISMISYRYIEVPWRTYFNNIARQREMNSVSTLQVQSGAIS